MWKTTTGNGTSKFHIGFALRTAYHETTQHTPAFLNFGRELTSVTGAGFDILREGETPTVGDCEDHSEKLQELKEIHKDVVTRLKEAHKKNAKRYNLRKRPAEFSEGARPCSEEKYCSVRRIEEFLRQTISSIRWTFRDHQKGFTLCLHTC